jgi:dTDP-4-amino-4,6-dideoxygalactose transaminase
MDELRSLGIGTSVHFIPVHQLSAYRRILGPEEIASVPVTDRVAAELLSLPMYPALADRDVDHIAAALGAIAARPRRGEHVLEGGGERVELAGHTD